MGTREKYYKTAREDMEAKDSATTEIIAAEDEKIRKTDDGSILHHIYISLNVLTLRRVRCPSCMLNLVLLQASEQCGSSLPLRGSALD